MLGNGTGEYTYQYNSKYGYWGYFENRSNALVVTTQGNVQLYRTDSPSTPVIEFHAGDPYDPRITINGYRVLTEQNGGGYGGGGSSGMNGMNNYSGGSVAIGDGANANSYSATAIGIDAFAGSSSSLAIGNDSRALYPDTVALGHNAVAYFQDAIAIGSSAFTSSGIAIGAYSSGNSDTTISIGYGATSGSPNATAIGYHSCANGENSTAIGLYTTTDSYGQVALGFYNNPSPNLAFMIGNGQNGNWGYDSNGNWRELGIRSNLFVITTEGKGIFRHTSYSEPTPDNPGAPQNSGGEALLVEGDATIKGTLRVSPSGDLDMGSFTTGTQP